MPSWNVPRMFPVGLIGTVLRDTSLRISGMPAKGIREGGTFGCLISAWMSRWKLGSMVRINGLFHLLINGVYWGYKPLILTIY